MRKIIYTLLIILLAMPIGTALAHDEESCKAVLILDVRARASVAPTSATYATIVNLTDDPVTITGGSTDRAEAVEIHTMAVDEDDVMSMTPLSDGLTIAPKTAAEFAPGGLHVMVIGLTEFFEAEDAYDLLLDFGEAGKLSLSVPILEIDDSMSHDEMGREVSFSVLGGCDDLVSAWIGGEAEHDDEGEDHEGDEHRDDATLTLRLVFEDGAEVTHHLPLVSAATLMEMEMEMDE